ncbi:Hypothetical predicted protein, partial [Mytilus galloprovincialis]
FSRFRAVCVSKAIRVSPIYKFRVPNKLIEAITSLASRFARTLTGCVDRYYTTFSTLSVKVFGRNMIEKKNNEQVTKQ